MERAVTTGSRKRSIGRVEGDGVDAEYVGDVSASCRVLTVTLERKVQAAAR